MKKQDKQKNITEKIAVVNGNHLEISAKQSISICKFITGKNPKEMIEKLEKVIQKRIAIPMHYEIPHRHNMPKGQVSGRYPKNASQIFIKLLKSLMANAAQKGLNEKELIIFEAQTNKAPRPKRGTRMAYGRKKFKRCHVIIKAKELKMKEKQKSKPEVKND